jgi:hypothetical protein
VISSRVIHKSSATFCNAASQASLAALPDHNQDNNHASVNAFEIGHNSSHVIGSFQRTNIQISYTSQTHGNRETVRLA